MTDRQVLTFIFTPLIDLLQSRAKVFHLCLHNIFLRSLFHQLGNLAEDESPHLDIQVVEFDPRGNRKRHFLKDIEEE